MRADCKQCTGSSLKVCGQIGHAPNVGGRSAVFVRHVMIMTIVAANVTQGIDDLVILHHE